MKSERRRYTKEFKEEAVKLVTEQGYRISEAARNLGINENMLSRWKQEQRDQDEIGSTRFDSPQSMATEIKRLEKENKRLKMEREILKKSGGLLCERIELRHQFILSAKKEYPISVLCDVLCVSRSGYYYWQKQASGSCRNTHEKRIQLVKLIHRLTKGSYGTRRMSRH